jgi:hypothetical protein
MPTKSIHSFGGVMFQVEHTPATESDPVPTIVSMRVLDADYKITGPDLAQLFDELVVPIKMGRRVELVPFLSIVKKEFENVNR